VRLQLLANGLLDAVDLFLPLGDLRAELSLFPAVCGQRFLQLADVRAGSAFAAMVSGEEMAHFFPSAG
jgi:hypothetical protein